MPVQYTYLLTYDATILLLSYESLLSRTRTIAISLYFNFRTDPDRVVGYKDAAAILNYSHYIFLPHIWNVYPSFFNLLWVPLRRPNPRLFLHPSPLPHIEQVKVAKLLGLVLTERLHFDDHVSAVLKVCSQRMYLLKLLRA